MNEWYDDGTDEYGTSEYAGAADGSFEFGAGGPEGGGYEGAYRAPEGGHWSQDSQWLQFADALMQALQQDPKVVEEWYGQFAEQAGLRGLAEAVAAAEAAAPTAKFGSKDFHAAAREWVRRDRERG